ncbi:hypothetical protein ACHAQA_003594 [Verticillium albo-atrum]
MLLGSFLLTLLSAYLTPSVTGAVTGTETRPLPYEITPPAQIADHYNRVPGDAVPSLNFHVRRIQKHADVTSNVEVPETAAGEEAQPLDKRGDGKSGWNPPGLIKNVTNAIIVITAHEFETDDED